MACTTVSVMPRHDYWFVEFPGKNLGPYMSKSMAVTVATNEALNRRRQGQQAKVAIRSETGDAELEYCLCAEFKRHGGVS